MISETRIVTIGGVGITYILTRKKVKNINLRIKQDGTVCVSAPKSVSVSYLDNFVKSKALFIHSALQEYKKLPKEPSPEQFYHNGDEFRYLGKVYTVKIVSSDGAGDDIYIENDNLIVSVFDINNEKYIRNLIQNRLYNRMTELFRNINDNVSEQFSKRYNIPKASIHIKYMRSRWGSCHVDDGILSINSRLIHYPEESIKYVFIHEYAHFVVPNHSKDFYRIVSEFMPDYQTWKNALK